MEIRALAPEEMDAVRDVRARAFGPLPDAVWERRIRAARPSVEDGRHLAGFEDGRVVATGTVHEMTQWWHGRPVPMGGVSAVTVAPEDRGRGLGRRMVARLLDLCASPTAGPRAAPGWRSRGSSRPRKTR